MKIIRVVFKLRKTNKFKVTVISVYLIDEIRNRKTKFKAH